MTQDEMRGRMETIVTNFHGGNEPRPVCEVLEEDLGIEASEEFEAHEYVHAFINAIAQTAIIKGGTTPGDIALLSFATGRKWGLIEATDALMPLEGDDDPQ